MKQPVGVLALAAVLLVAAPVTASAESMDAGHAFMKLARGATNLLTGWVEIPKRIHETWNTSGAFAGFTWGLLRGIGHGFVRTAAGGYELVTFPVPGSTNYGPVLQPEYVFSEPASSSSTTYSK